VDIVDMKKTRELRIRCSEETYREFKVFIAEMGFKNYEEGLKYLLKKERKRSRVFTEPF